MGEGLQEGGGIVLSRQVGRANLAFHVTQQSCCYGLHPRLLRLHCTWKQEYEPVVALLVHRKAILESKGRVKT